MMSSGAVFYLLMSVLSVAAFCAGIKAGRTRRWRAMWWTSGALGLILFKTLLHARPVLEAALFPWPAYVYFQSYWLYPIGLFFFGLAICQLPVRWNRVVLSLVAALFFAYSLWAERWMVCPPDDSSTQRATPDHHCRQTTMYTCVPASCVTLLSYWGVDETEGAMARLCHTRQTGTTEFNAYRGLKLRLTGSDLDARMVSIDKESFCSLREPVLMFDGAIGHAVVMQYDGSEVIYWDPLVRSVERLSLEHAWEDMRTTGVVLIRR